MITKTSIRYFNSNSIRARWSDEDKKWWYSATDVVHALTNSNNARRYWNTIKSRNVDLASSCKQIKLRAKDSKLYESDVLDFDGASLLLATIKCDNKIEFIKWIKGLANPIDEESRVRAYNLYDDNIIESIDVGTIKGLQEIHAYLFEGIYNFAGKIRDKNISKGGFIFANYQYLEDILANIEKMPENSFYEIVEKYVEMNIAHPFMEGNGRATRIWLDLIFRRCLRKSVDWSKIDKRDYLEAMEESPNNDKKIKDLLEKALTDDIKNQEIYMKGIDYSYYYEEIE